jgi:hypothetical protein
MQAAINNDNNIILLGISKITLSLTSPYSLTQMTNPSLAYILLTVPTDLTPISSTCIPSYGSAVCSQPSTQVFNITNIGNLPTTLNIKFNSQTSYFINSSTFDIKMYYSSSLVLTNTQLVVKSFCENPCKQCTTVQTQCLSCLPSPYTSQLVYFSFNDTCLISCPDTYFLVNSSLSCSKCNASACLTCQNSDSFCLICSSGKSLYNNTCLSVCPTGYYSLSGQCLACVSPCATCSGTGSTCLSCVSNYFSDIGTNSSNCVKVCSNSNYLGVGGQCKQCTQNCKTCSVSLNNCTSCD